VDWNSNGAADETDLRLDINYIVRAAQSVKNPGEILLGHDDWSNLIYGFRACTQFSRSVLVSGMAAGELTARDYLNECLGGPRTSGDALKFDGGILRAEPPDVVDLNRATAGPSATRIDMLDAVRAARQAAGLDL
jgi:hypothetical protein